ncbi:MAG: OmpA family protein [Bacteroidia bacterium]|nr:OmpA family protein [Bacteroidia bacterium]
MAELSVTFMDYRALQTNNFFEYKQFDPGITMAGHAYLNKALNLSINTSFVPEVDWIDDEGIIKATSLLDANALLQFKTNGTIFEEDALIAPYLATGFGVNSASNVVRLYVPATLGIKLQVNENFSLNFAATYKQRLVQNQFQHMAYTAGFVFGMPSNKKKDEKEFEPKKNKKDNKSLALANMDSDGDGVSDEDDLCPDVKGKVMYLGCPEGVGKTTTTEVTTNETKPKEEIKDTEFVEPKTQPNDMFGSAMIKDEKKKSKKPETKVEPLKEITPEDLEMLEFAMKNIYFEPASDKLKPESYPVLADVAKLMDKYKGYSLEVLGHTDNSGNHQNNVILSVMRAYRVKYYLVNQMGIKMSRIASDGQSSKNPSYDNSTAEGRAKNRRVDLKMIPSSEVKTSMFRGSPDLEKLFKDKE